MVHKRYKVVLHAKQNDDWNCLMENSRSKIPLEGNVLNWNITGLKNMIEIQMDIGEKIVITEPWSDVDVIFFQTLPRRICSA